MLPVEFSWTLANKLSFQTLVESVTLTAYPYFRMLLRNALCSAKQAASETHPSLDPEYHRFVKLILRMELALDRAEDKSPDEKLGEVSATLTLLQCSATLYFTCPAKTCI